MPGSRPPAPDALRELQRELRREPEPTSRLLDGLANVALGWENVRSPCETVTQARPRGLRRFAVAALDDQQAATRVPGT